jgi:PleD family two-component response regulator
LGVACIVPSSKSSTDRLIAEADEALYQAKIGFGDRVVFNQGNFGNY